jgi:4-hydroxybenzoate polyprenyltransferase
MPRIFLNALILMRFHSSTGYLLAFFPAFFGLMLGYKDRGDLVYVPIFLIGAILARGAGCIINDIVDRDFDRQVERTKNRPLANGDVTTKEAQLILAGIGLICASLLFFLPKIAIILSLVAAILTAIYPLMKRFTHFPQIVLGITFNLGALIAYATVQNALSIQAVMLYIACGFWTLAYDTLYAFADIDDDKKIGIKSTAIFFEDKNISLVIGIFYMLFFTFFGMGFWGSLGFTGGLGLAAAIVLARWIMRDVPLEEKAGYLYKFKLNAYIGFILSFSILLEKI